jgi:hypothetical protein
MRSQLSKLSVIHAATLLVWIVGGNCAVAQADPTAPINACPNPAGPCNNAGPQNNQPGTCVRFVCSSFGVIYECPQCMLADAGSWDAAIEAAGGSGSTSNSGSTSGSSSASGTAAASGSAPASGSLAASGTAGTSGSPEAGSAGASSGSASGTAAASGRMAASGAASSGSISPDHLQTSGGCSLSGPAGEAGTAAGMFGIGLASLAWGRRRRR